MLKQLFKIYQTISDCIYVYNPDCLSELHLMKIEMAVIRKPTP